MISTALLEGLADLGTCIDINSIGKDAGIRWDQVREGGCGCGSNGLVALLGLDAVIVAVIIIVVVLVVL